MFESALKKMSSAPKLAFIMTLSNLSQYYASHAHSLFHI
jgi:hypothetical protein